MRRRLLAQLLSNAATRRGLSTGIYTTQHATAAPDGVPAFVFDIDGVLIRGKHVLPAAKAAMTRLSQSGRWLYPVVFLTNGGGVSEARKAEQLSSWLQVPVTEQQVVLSHSPMRDLVPRLGDQPVLISGMGDVLNVARAYGFTQAVSTQQLAAAWPTATPFLPHTTTVTPPIASHLPGHHHAHAHLPLHGLGSEDKPIRAVLVMTDPTNWYADLQLIIDVLATKGVPTRKEAPADAAPVELFFSNQDLLWANEHPRNRFGQGAFKHILISLYKETLGINEVDFPVKTFGKPNPEPYRLAERLLTAQAVELGLVDPTHLQQPGAHLPFSAIYAVGDNPAADVRGANAAGAPWVSVLVHTGVFQGPGHNCSRDVAQVAVRDVEAAVHAGLHRARSIKFHSMR